MQRNGSTSANASVLVRDLRASARGERLATFDRALAGLHPDVAPLVGEPT